ncbi:membrane-associated phosphatidylinositol transfer protein 2 isoform X6 [Mobula birostris]|uniref:membrane-associated phosphatidylinositol transfer protein 2 isoform X6 n=1 Tax=Mobula birostris TaxID=1983395 RepID=UPI003B2844FC
MLIKEYHIPLPMSVEEYRIAQLYMIQKKSREETCGEGSGVEILENRPYNDGPGGSGQYTHKVYHIGMHIPSWFRSILPKAALRVEEESWNAYPYTRTRYTCPFVEKFSIDIETYYKADSGDQANVFNLSAAEKRQRMLDPIDIVKDPIPPNEYKTEEDPKQYKSTKTGRGPLSDNWIEECKNRTGKMPIMCAYKLCKVEFRYWGMQSKIERFIHDVASPSRHNISDWRMQSIARDSDDSSDDEFFDAQEDFSDNEESFPQEITKWNSNDLIDKIEACGETEERPCDLYQGQLRDYIPTSAEQLNPVEIHNTLKNKSVSTSIPKITVTSLPADEPSLQTLQSCKVHMLVLILHGGNILDPGSGDQTSKQADVNTITSVFDTVMRVHFPAGLGHIAVKLVPCPAICSEAFSLVSNLSPLSYDEGCLSNNQDHIPLAALPLLATASPQYQEAVATVIFRANQVYSDFIKSQEGASFNGQVCLIGDCVGGILGFDALCFSNQTVSESQNSSRRGSVLSVQDNDLLSPGIIVNNTAGSNLESSRHLSRSNIDIPRSSTDNPNKQLPRKRSDSSTYELDTIKHHQAFLSSLQSSVLRTDSGSRRSSSSTMLEGMNPGKFEFEVTDFFLFGSPLGLVLALRKTVVPSLDVSLLRPACQQVYNLFHPADPSSSRLEPLLEKKFHLLPPFNVPRYQRFPLGDGTSAVLVETIQNNPILTLEIPFVSLHRKESVMETSIPVPVINWHDGTSGIPTVAESDVIQTHVGVFAEGSSPSSPSTAPIFRAFRRASETSIASQVSGMADSYTASNITNIATRWWGTKRVDYALYCPDALTAFPTVALPHLFHASYWESTDVVSFLLRQIMRHENASVLELDGKEVSVFSPSKPREKWLRKRTHVKLRNVTANHRVNDVIVSEDGPQTLTGRFMYGPLDMVTLTGEKVDIHIMTQPPTGEWVYFDTDITNSSGRISYVIPESKRLGIGVYPVKMVIRGDHTSGDSYITVLPKGTECVVFSIDGSFAASVSIMGSDPKVRAGAVDVVRHWQDLGYFIVYVTGRPDMQKQRVVAWLAQHNFPHGIVSFCDGLVHDPLRHKANFLRSLVQDVSVKVHAAYGSTKDISVYASLGLSPSQIYIVGRSAKKYQNQCQFLTDGYAAHLSQLEYNQRSRPAKSNSRMVLRKGSFGLAAQPDFLRKRNQLLRTISGQQTTSTSSKPERTQSQSEGERDRDKERGHRSMSITAGCWGRTGTSKLESGV